MTGERFPSEVRPEHVTVEALRLLKRYVANDNLIIGGQSGSASVLARSHRGHGVAEVERAVRLARQEGALDRLTSAGRAYGPWQRQAEVARQLAVVRWAERGYRIRRTRPSAGTSTKRRPTRS